MTGSTHTYVAVMEHAPEANKRLRKKTRPSRAGKKSAQGTSHVVRKQRLLAKIAALMHENEVLQTQYDLAVQEKLEALARAQVARYDLKVSENTSAHRLLLIKNEVPEFSVQLLQGAFDCYSAVL